MKGDWKLETTREYSVVYLGIHPLFHDLPDAYATKRSTTFFSFGFQNQNRESPDSVGYDSMIPERCQAYFKMRNKKNMYFSCII